MTLIDGNVTLFDCIEFNPELRWIDVISEIAFLVIDLLHFGYEPYAFRLLNRYLQHTGDYAGLALLRYYLVYRALVLAKVALLRRAQQQGDHAIGREYRLYADLAERFSQNKPIALIITHGYSGSGKSTWASQLAEKINALQLRSDIERKRLFAYQPLDNTGSGVNLGLYTPAVGQQTYRRLAELARTVIDSGFTAIIDAAFLKSEQRTLFRQLATECDVPFIIIDFQTSEAELARRIQQRQQQQNDPSEATIAVLQQQLKSAQALSIDEQVVALTVDTESEHVLEKLLASLPAYLH